MSTRSVPRQPASFPRGKYAVFGFIFLMMAYVLNHNERFLIDWSHPVWQHYEPFKWYLLPHGLAAACALLLGPMQFSDRLRRRYTKLHRVVGRIYVIGALIGAPMGAYIQIHFNQASGGTRSFSLATLVDAFLWMSTTAIAFYFATQGKIQQHRQWMTRSYAVALAFLEIRVITGLGGWETDHGTETVVWFCVAMSLLLADVAIQWQESRPARTT